MGKLKGGLAAWVAAHRKAAAATAAAPVKAAQAAAKTPVKGKAPPPQVAAQAAAKNVPPVPMLKKATSKKHKMQLARGGNTLVDSKGNLTTNYG